MGLPFATEVQDEAEDCSGAQCSLRNLLPDALRERADEAPHLMEYLHLVPIKDIGVPDYYEDLNRKAGDLEAPNLIYRVDEQRFVHIFPDMQDARDFYISIEPAMLQKIQPILEQIERRLLDYVEELSAAETEEQKAEVLIRAVDENCAVSGRGGGKAPAGRNGGGLV